MTDSRALQNGEREDRMERGATDMHIVISFPNVVG